MSKTKIYIFIVCAIVITGGGACNQVMESSAETDKLEQLKKEFGDVGRQHNESLDHVLQSYDQLKKDNLTPIQIRNHTMDISRRQLATYYKVKEVKDLAAQIHDREAYRVSGPSEDRMISTAGTDQSYYARTLELPGLEKEVKKYLKQIGKVIDSGARPTEVESRIRQIVRDAAAELPEEELNTVFLAAEVGISSARYWEENGQQWRQKIKELEGNEAQSRDLDPMPDEIMYKKNIIKSDIAGAVGGAVASAVTGCAQLTLGACAGVGAAAGGLGGSATAAAQAFLDYIWESKPIGYPDVERKLRQVQTNANQ